MYVVIILQAMTRGYATRRANKNRQISAVKIQKTFRRFRCVNNYNIMKKAIVIINKTVKKYNKKVSLLNEKKSVNMISNWWLSVISNIKIKNNKIIRNNNALIIQKILRSYQCKKTVKIMRNYYKQNIIKLQSFIRGKNVYINYNKKIKSVKCIQKNLRNYISNKKFIENRRRENNIKNQQIIFINKMSLVISTFFKSVVLKSRRAKAASSIQR